jgi:hypothetical protein
VTHAAENNIKWVTKIARDEVRRPLLRELGYFDIDEWPLKR